MRSSVKAIFILILIFVATIPGYRAFSQTVDYASSISALEYRVSELEKALKVVADSVSKETGGTLVFYQEAGKAIKKTSQRVDSVEQRMSSVERKQVDVEELTSRVNALEAQLLELKRKRPVLEKSGDDIKLQPAAYQPSQKQDSIVRYERVTPDDDAIKRISADDTTDIHTSAGIIHTCDTSYIHTLDDTADIHALADHQDVVRRDVRYHTVICTEHWEPDGRVISAAAGVLVCGIAILCSRLQR